jgi:hypothetical protein
MISLSGIIGHMVNFTSDLLKPSARSSLPFAPYKKSTATRHDIQMHRRVSDIETPSRLVKELRQAKI